VPEEELQASTARAAKKPQNATVHLVRFTNGAESGHIRLSGLAIMISHLVRIGERSALLPPPTDVNAK
jgi:hypothetical protein